MFAEDEKYKDPMTLETPAKIIWSSPEEAVTLSEKIKNERNISIS